MDKKINSGTIVFDFEHLSKEVFQERASAPGNKPNWEELVSDNQTYNMDEAFKQFVEDVKNSKENYIIDSKIEVSKQFDQEFYDFFYEGGQATYEKALTDGGELNYKSFAMDYFINLYEDYLNTLTEKKKSERDPKVSEIIKNKDYKELSILLKNGIQDYLNGDVECQQ
ncbi:hypothetical protein [Lactococcus garvieae]|uniref:hypothetical protein n=1 Tax=Lactococcus garvieae TaxID=1363 RepID=UPI00254C20B4|nr:hypothetical protein [Lactococcus garvieae]